MTDQNTTRPSLTPLLVAFAAFVLLGLADGMLGVAWPSLRQSFGASLEQFGVLAAAGVAGFLISSSNSGRLIGRLSMGPLLFLAAGLRGAGFLTVALAPSWEILLAGYFVSAIGSGAIDAGLNTYVSARYSAGRLNWLHACFGLGATIGPTLMTAVLAAGNEWRVGYGVLVGAQLALAAVVMLTLPAWRLRDGQSAEADADEKRAVPYRETLRLPLVWLGIALFILYTGIELSVGQWPYSMYTEARGIDVTLAGAWVSLFWGGLTLGRFVAGLLTERLGVGRILRLSMGGVLIGAVLVGLNVEALNAAGMALTGFALASIFPLLIATTRDRVGRRHAPNAIGFQVAAAGTGFAVLPGLAGVLAGAVGLEVIGPFLVVSALVMWGVYEFTARWERARGPVGEAVGAAGK